MEGRNSPKHFAIIKNTKSTHKMTQTSQPISVPSLRQQNTSASYRRQPLNLMYVELMCKKEQEVMLSSRPPGTRRPPTDEKRIDERLFFQQKTTINKKPNRPNLSQEHDVNNTDDNLIFSMS